VISRGRGSQKKKKVASAKMPHRPGPPITAMTVRKGSGWESPTPRRGGMGLNKGNGLPRIGHRHHVSPQRGNAAVFDTGGSIGGGSRGFCGQVFYWQRVCFKKVCRTCRARWQGAGPITADDAIIVSELWQWARIVLVRDDGRRQVDGAAGRLAPHGAEISSMADTEIEAEAGMSIADRFAATASQ